MKNEINASSLEDTETSSPLPNSGLAREDVTEKSESLTKSLRFIPPNVPCVPTSTVGSCKISSPVVPSTPDNGKEQISTYIFLFVLCAKSNINYTVDVYI